MIRSQFLEVLKYVAHARIEMDGLKKTIISDLERGFRPQFRGHVWEKSHFDQVEAAAFAIQAAFDCLKSLQFPEDKNRDLDAAFKILAIKSELLPADWEDR